MQKQRQTGYVVLFQATKKSLVEGRLRSYLPVQYLGDAFCLLIYPVVLCTDEIQCFLQHMSFDPVFQRNLSTVTMAEPSWVLRRGHKKNSKRDKAQLMIVVLILCKVKLPKQITRQ